VSMLDIVMKLGDSRDDDAPKAAHWDALSVE
jgi:hypothetical protein